MLSPFRNAAVWPSQALDSVACVCLWGACACRVWSCVLRGQLLQCRSLEELWKNEVMSFALFHSFSGAREQRKTAALAVKLEEVDVCVCERGVNNFLQSFWLFPRAVFGPIHVILIYFLCMYWKINLKIYNGLCCALETEFTKKNGQIFETSTPLGTVRVMNVLCASNLFCLLCYVFLQYYIPDLKLSLCTEVCIRLAKDPLQTK